MSTEAICLLHWVGQTRNPVNNDDEREFCLICARMWANYILAGLPLQ